MYFNGTKSCVLALSCLLSLPAIAKDLKTINAKGLNKPMCFVENKGQVKDQDNNPRNDIQYKLSSPGMNLYAGNGQLHYQFMKTEGDITGGDAKITTYRMDVTLLGANPNAKVTSAEEQDYYENYFSGQSNNALTVHSFDKIVYKDVYPGIDWMLYVKNGQVEYDFIVHPGADVHNIQLKYDGATKLGIANDGSLAAETPLGTVKEKTPYSFETETGTAVASRFVLHDNVLGFEAGAHNGTLTIDPQLNWSTYLGTTLEDVATCIKTTTTGVVFVGGYTSSSTGALATGPALHTAYQGGTYDGFLSKYSSTGALLFTTYFGGTLTDKVMGVALDNTGAGNPAVFIAGVTNSTTLGAGPVVAYHGNNDGFVAKLNNAGTAITWYTYYGGTGNDAINGIACDASNNVYITGQTASTAGINTSGAYQTVLSGTTDAFAAKLNGASGAVVWGTYYGGTGQEQAYGIALDNANDVIITGQTNSVINIASTGAYQTSLLGSNDAFVAKLNPTGTARIWGTYLGGSGQDQTNAVVCSQSSGDIAVTGNTTSGDHIASAKAYQATYEGGPQDAFVSYFNDAGTLIWSSYLGGINPDYGQGITMDNLDNVVITGATFSTTNIANNASQPAKYGDYDAFVSKFNTFGQMLWSSYFGGLYYDYANAVTVDNNNQILIAGFTTSSPTSGIYGSDGIATVGAAKTTFSGGTYDAFISKFLPDVYATISQPFNDVLICAGGTLKVNYTANGTFNAGNVFTIELSNATGSFASPVAIGTFSATISGVVTCVIPSGTALGTGYRIRVTGSNPVYVSPDDYYDITIVNSIPATVASGVTPTCVGGVISLNDNATYIVTNYSWTGPALSGPSGTGFTANIKNPFNNGFAGLGTTKNDSGVYYVTTSHNGCPDQTASVSITVNDIIPPTPTLSVATLNCAGSPLSLFANPDTTAPGITYNWSGPAGFTSTVQNPVRTGAKLTYAGTYTLIDSFQGCPSMTATVTVTVTDSIHDEVRVTVSPDDTVCKGTLVTFTAHPLNGGGSPLYQWYIARGTTVNAVVGAVSDVFSSPTLLDGDIVYCTLKSSLICPSPIMPNSNSTDMNVISNPPIVKIFSSDLNVAPGDSIVFTSAIYNGGIAPEYQWLANGKPIAEANFDSYTLHNVRGPITISLVLTSTMLCSVPNYSTSNEIPVNTNVAVPHVATSLDNLDLFPNPNTGSFAVKGTYNNAGTVTMDVMNLLGQVMYTTVADVQNNAVNKTISLGNVADGVYMLRISANGQSKTLRFTIAN